MLQLSKAAELTLQRFSALHQCFDVGDKAELVPSLFLVLNLETTNWIIVASLQYKDLKMQGRHLDSVTSTQKYDFVNRRPEQSCQISSRILDAIWNDRASGFFEECHPNKNNQNKNNSSNIELVPEPKVISNMSSSNSISIFQPVFRGTNQGSANGIQGFHGIELRNGNDICGH